MYKLGRVFQLFLLVLIGFMAVAIIICIIQANYLEAGKGGLFIALMASVYFALGVFVRKPEQSGSQDSSGFLWQCPSCATVLMKNFEQPDLIGLLGAENVVGTVTCSECQAVFPRDDIYNGKYDVPL